MYFIISCYAYDVRVAEKLHKQNMIKVMMILFIYHFICYQQWGKNGCTGIFSFYCFSFLIYYICVLQEVHSGQQRLLICIWCILFVWLLFLFWHLTLDLGESLFSLQPWQFRHFLLLLQSSRLLGRFSASSSSPAVWGRSPIMCLLLFWVNVNIPWSC